MLIRALDPAADRAAVEALFLQAADYVRLERDADPDPSLAEEFFTEAPPGCDPAASLRLGLYDGDALIGIAELAFGYPAATDAYLGLMILGSAARGRGAGTAFLRALETRARAGGATQMYLAVLDANPRGRAFWEREGFALALANRPVTLGTKTQIAHRLGKAL